MKVRAMTMRPLALLLLFPFLLGWAAVARSAEWHEIPLRFYGTRPAVEVWVNQHGPFLFLIDTGAAGPPARADEALVRRLSIAQGGTAQTSDAGGASRSVDRITLADVELGGIAFHGVEALSRDYGAQSYLPKIDGILGINFFRDWLIAIDFSRGTLVLEKGQLPKADGRTILAYELIEGNPYIPARIGNRPVKLLLDTGNIRALDLPSDWIKTFRLASFPRLAGNAAGVSGTSAIREVRLADTLVIGMYRFEQPAVTFADDFAEANVGSTLLQEFTVTLDQRNQRVRLVRNRRY
jgi:hypothetical protein